MKPVELLEEAGVKMQSGFAPLNVKIQGERDAKVPIVDLEHVADVEFQLDQIGFAVQRNVHVGVIPRQTHVRLNVRVAGDVVRHCRG